MYLMERFPFRKIGGYDLSEELVQIANQNFQKLGISRCHAIQADAMAYEDYDEYNYFYIFNAFPQEVFERMMNRVLESLKRSFNRKPEEPDHSRQYQECDLLILDDFGAEKNGAWQDQELFRLIDYRYTRRLPVIVTANSPVDQLDCNTRIVDRLYDMTVMIHLPEEGIRAKKADERKRRFLDSVISK